MTTPPVAQRIEALRLGARPGTGGRGVRRADRALLANASEDLIDTTHFDTVAFPPPDWALPVFAAAAEDGRHAYTPYRGDPGVLSRVAGNIASCFGLAYDPDGEVILTPGSQAALFTALSCLTDPGDAVALFDPEYLFNERMIRFLGALPVSVPLGPTGPDLDRLEAAFAAGARVLVFSNPSNPTGLVHGRETLETIAALAVRHGVTVIVDELYNRLVYPRGSDDAPFVHLASIDGMRGRTVTIMGVSKTESLTGYRIAVALGPPAIVDAMEDVLSIAALRAPAYSQHILSNWLAEPPGWLDARRAALDALRTVTLDRIDRSGVLSAQRPEGTAYAWVDATATGLDGFDLARRLVDEAGVLVSPGYQFGPGSGSMFRLCFARDPATWEVTVDRVCRVLEVAAVTKPAIAGAG